MRTEYHAQCYCNEQPSLPPHATSSNSVVHTHLPRPPGLLPPRTSSLAAALHDPPTSSHEESVPGLRLCRLPRPGAREGRQVLAFRGRRQPHGYLRGAYDAARPGPQSGIRHLGRKLSDENVGTIAGGQGSSLGNSDVGSRHGGLEGASGPRHRRRTHFLRNSGVGTNWGWDFVREERNN